MQQIVVILTTSSGVVIKKTLTKPDGQPVQLSLPPETKLAIEVRGPSAKKVPSMSATPPKLHVKRLGDDLVIEGEGEPLVKVTQYYTTEDVSLGTTHWDPTEPEVLSDKPQVSDPNVISYRAPETTPQASSQSTTERAMDLSEPAPAKPQQYSVCGDLSQTSSLRWVMRCRILLRQLAAMPAVSASCAN